MVGKLFANRPPEPEEHVLDPGCGQGAFIAGILRWCAARGVAAPRITGVESDPRHAAFARERYAGLPNIEIRECDFLAGVDGRYHYVIGNPPYVALTSLSEGEKAEYRRAFATASGRFDLYLLFFEQALRLLAPKSVFKNLRTYEP